MQRSFPTRWGSDHEISSTACHKHCNNSPPHQLSNCSHFSVRDMPHERDANGRNFRPPFPFVNITGGSPHTPTCKSGLLLLYDARQMEYITLPHLFRSDSGQSGRNFRNPVESSGLFFVCIFPFVEEFQSDET